MPWIVIALPNGVGVDVVAAEEMAADLARAAARALMLSTDDVVVLFQWALASWGEGAVVTIAGRDRGVIAEEGLQQAVQERLTEWLGIDPDLVAFIRT